MSDKLGDTTPLAGLTPEPAPGAGQQENRSTVDRVLNPEPDAAYTGSDRDGEPSLLGALVRPLLDADNLETRNPDADDGTTDNSQA